MVDDLVKAVLDDDQAGVNAMLAADPTLAAQTFDGAQLYEEIAHWIYEGDTVLHLAAAAHHPETVSLLLASGADPAARSRRGGTPLHYASDGLPGSSNFDSERQVETILRLLDSGADILARDNNGATALHRAVRTRCARAVAALLEAGCDPETRNKAGSTAFHLAVQNTGRGGSGSDEAKRAQREIVEAFLAHRVPTGWIDGKGRSVIESASATWIKELLQAGA